MALYNQSLQITNVSDRGASECMDPEGNGVNPGKGVRGGPGPPSEEQDKQLISNSGGDEASMGESGRQQDESDVASRTHHAEYIVL